MKQDKEDSVKANHLYQVCTCPMLKDTCPIHGQPPKTTFTTSTSAILKHCAYCSDVIMSECFWRENQPELIYCSNYCMQKANDQVNEVEREISILWKGEKMVPESLLAAQSDQIRLLQEEVVKWKRTVVHVSDENKQLESLLSAEKEKHGEIAKEAFDIAEYYKIIEMDEYLTDKSTYLSSLTQTDVKTEK